MDAAQVATIVFGAGGTVAALLAYFKYKPGQRERVGMDVAEGTLNIAQGSIALVTSTLQAQFIRMDAEMEDMRREHETYREDTDKRLAEMAVELRAERAEKIEVKRENAVLIARVKRAEARVQTLEAEVAALKGSRG